MLLSRFLTISQVANLCPPISQRAFVDRDVPSFRQPLQQVQRLCRPHSTGEQIRQAFPVFPLLGQSSTTSIYLVLYSNLYASVDIKLLYTASCVQYIYIHMHSIIYI